MNVLGHARAAAFHRAALVRFMTIGASHLSFQNRVAMRQLKLRSDIEVTLKAGLRRPLRIDDQVGRAAALGVQTSRPVTGFTPDVHRVCSRRFQPCMRGGAKITHDFLVAIGAFVGPDKFRAGHAGRGHDRAIVVERSAGEERHGEHIRAADRPKQSQPMSIDPPNQPLGPHLDRVLGKNARAHNRFFVTVSLRNPEGGSAAPPSGISAHRVRDYLVGLPSLRSQTGLQGWLTG